MSDDPWSTITTTVQDGTINGRRIDARLPWSLFWALGSGRKCLLVFRYQTGSQAKTALPKLKGLEVTCTEPDQQGWRSLLLKLLDSTQRDIFHRLCVDIVNATSSAKTEPEAVNLFLARTWRWHHLLRGGFDSKLSTEEQKGLIGELIVLDTLLLPNLSTKDAIAAWTGPLGAPKDFEVARLCIEAKARRGAATPFVAISSEYQLDTSGVDSLYLHVVELDKATPGAEETFTVTSVATKIRDRIATLDPGLIQQYENLLLSSGFTWQDDYTDSYWVQGSSSIFEIREAFPRITADSFPSGVTNVRYSIALKDCIGFTVNNEIVVNKLRRIKNGNASE